MAFTSNKLLKTDSHVLLRDQQHAARLFSDDQFRLAPRFDFQFHVAFGLNQAALKTIDLAQRHRNEIGMLVRSTSLPKFTISSDQANQYNRRKQIQYQHKVEDITINFHDDNMGVINQLWQNYYSYYYADPTSATSAGAYNRNATRSSDYINNPYGLDNGSTEPFFTYIKLYQMARHEYICYTLYNPLVKSWDYMTVDYSKKETHNFNMTVGYEAVSFSTGEVTAGDPIGFGIEHYDTVPSPLSGQVDGTSLSPSFVGASALAGNANSFLNNLITTNNAYQNTQTQQPAGTPGLLSPSVNPPVCGLPGIIFPTAQAATNNTTTATAVKLGP